MVFVFSLSRYSEFKNHIVALGAVGAAVSSEKKGDVRAII